MVRHYSRTPEDWKDFAQSKSIPLSRIVRYNGKEVSRFLFLILFTTVATEDILH